MSQEFKHIIRFVGTDLDGTKKIAYGLAKIRGLDVPLAHAILRIAEIDPNKRIGNLTESEIQKIESILADPLKHGVPAWLVNRPGDLETGQPRHLVGPDLTIRIKSDIDFMQKIRTWKGIRHSLGLKVRGQRTRTTGRFGKAVGVRKAVIIAAARAAAAAGVAGTAGAPGAPAAPGVPAAPGAKPAPGAAPVGPASGAKAAPAGPAPAKKGEVKEKK